MEYNELLDWYKDERKIISIKKEKALEKLGVDVVITKDADVILSADKVILPGVGAFGDAMDNLRKYKLDEVIYRVVEKGIPFL